MSCKLQLGKELDGLSKLPSCLSLKVCPLTALFYIICCQLNYFPDREKIGQQQLHFPVLCAVRDEVMAIA